MQNEMLKDMMKRKVEEQKSLDSITENDQKLRNESTTVRESMDENGDNNEYVDGDPHQMTITPPTSKQDGNSPVPRLDKTLSSMSLLSTPKSPKSPDFSFVFPQLEIKKNFTKMKLYVRIDGIDPFVLRLNDNLKLSHYVLIAEQYYSELYEGKPPGDIFLKKAMKFKNGDRLVMFKRRETLLVKFQYQVQLKTPIYEEIEACPESVTLQETINPSLCSGMVYKIASLNRLLLKITDPYTQPYHLNVFWQQYTTFTKPPIVLKKFIERYHVPDLLYGQFNYSTQEQLFYYYEVKPKIQHKVLSIFYEWIDAHYFTFSDEMIITLKEFLSTVAMVDFPALVKQILSMMDKNSRISAWEKFEQNQARRPKASLLGDLKQNINILNVSAKELAEQLTLLDFEKYKSIHYSELLDQQWTKAKKRHLSPNIMNNISFLNHVSGWVATTILEEPVQAKRTRVIKRFIETIYELIKLNSYNMLMAVNSGLSGTAVYRLTETWEEIDETTLQYRDRVAEITSTKNNYLNFRKAMDVAYDNGQSCSPYLGVYLRDIVFIGDGNPKLIDGKINWNKCMQTYNATFQILRFQKRPYNFTALPHIRTEIEYFTHPGDDALYEKSLLVQPKQ